VDPACKFPYRCLDLVRAIRIRLLGMAFRDGVAGSVAALLEPAYGGNGLWQ
jgi:hypothetical protein